MDTRRERIIVRSLKKLQNESVAFTAGRILEESNLTQEGLTHRMFDAVSAKTITGIFSQGKKDSSAQTTKKSESHGPVE